ncbi:MAG: hypothetical protein WC788_00135 [Candidatus Paceibacterota bacterium]|jgi:hypothetical protein
MNKNIVLHVLKKLGINVKGDEKRNILFKPRDIPDRVYLFDISRITPRCNGVVSNLYLKRLKEDGFKYNGIMNAKSGTAVLTLISSKICEKHGREYVDVPCLRIRFCEHCTAEARNRHLPE